MGINAEIDRMLLRRRVLIAATVFGVLGLLIISGLAIFPVTFTKTHGVARSISSIASYWETTLAVHIKLKSGELIVAKADSSQVVREGMPVEVMVGRTVFGSTSYTLLPNVQIQPYK